MCGPKGIKACNTSNCLWRASLDSFVKRRKSQITAFLISDVKERQTVCLILEFCRGPPVLFCYSEDPAVPLNSHRQKKSYPFTNTGAWLCQGMPPLGAKALQQQPKSLSQGEHLLRPRNTIIRLQLK